jgi:hypothetical protein
MLQATDMRIPILFGIQPETGDATLVEDGQDMPAGGYAMRFSLPATLGHKLGCACCTLRGPAADALGRMFRARATGAAPFFKRVVVLASASGEAAVREALARDVLTAARYREEGYFL